MKPCRKHTNNGPPEGEVGDCHYKGLQTQSQRLISFNSILRSHKSTFKTQHILEKTEKGMQEEMGVGES